MSRFHSQTPISDLRFIKDYLRRALSLINLLIQTQLVGFLNRFLEAYLDYSSCVKMYPPSYVCCMINFK